MTALPVSPQPGLPLTVIGGYLGAGKTTLINRLLQLPHGLRLMVLVNDFGAINIDAQLLVSAEADRIELTNGCVCCSLGADLFHAVGDVLDRQPRPDHLLIEASGIADPARIARLALTEPELSYAGIVTVVDGPGLPGLLANPLIADQIAGQIRSADVLAFARGAVPDGGPSLSQSVHRINADDAAAVLALLRDPMPAGPPEAPALSAPHPDYIHRAHGELTAMDRDQIGALLACRPASVLRLKALIPDPKSGGWEVHAVGPTEQIRHIATLPASGLVAIALKDGTDVRALDHWWQQWQQGH